MSIRVYDANYYVMYVGQDSSRSSFVSSVGSAAVTRLIMAPLSRLSTLLSVNRLSHTVDGLPARMFPALRALYRTYGLRSFWRGSFLAIAKHGSALGSVHVYQRWKERIGIPGYSGSVLSGLLAGWMSSSISYPIDVLKTRVMVSVDDAPKLWERLTRDLSVKSLFRGYWVECMDIIPSVAISNMLYEHVLFQYCKQFPHGDFLFQSAAAAGTSALVGGTLTYPLVFLRRNMQIEVTCPEQRTLRSIVSTTYSQYGKRGFYRGLAPHLMSLVPQMTVGLLLFEAGRDYLKRRSTEIQKERDAHTKKQ